MFKGKPLSCDSAVISDDVKCWSVRLIDGEKQFKTSPSWDRFIKVNMGKAETTWKRVTSRINSFWKRVTNCDSNPCALTDVHIKLSLNSAVGNALQVTDFLNLHYPGWGPRGTTFHGSGIWEAWGHFLYSVSWGKDWNAICNASFFFCPDSHNWSVCR